MRFLVWAGVLAVSLLGAGCAEVRLDNGTDDLSRSLSNLYVRQALNNFSRLIDDEHAIPSQVDITAGTVQTMDAVTPSLTIPLSSQITDSFMGAARTHGRTLGAFGGTVGVAASTSNNWNLLPVGDSNVLRNLRALYRYALFGTDLVEEYNPYEIVLDGTFYLDPYHLRRPRCVLCYDGKEALISDKRLLKPNKALRTKWLYSSAATGGATAPNSPPVGAPLVDLGRFGDHDLFMTEDDFKAGVLDDFVLFIMPNGPINATYQVSSAGTPTPVGKPQRSGKSTIKKGVKPSTPAEKSDEGRAAPSPGRFLTILPTSSIRSGTGLFSAPPIGIQSGSTP